MTATCYLRRLFLVALLITVAMAALNYYADPYGVWRYGLPSDPIRSRPAIRNQERLHKAHAIRFADADCIILGNSRVVVGIDPNHSALPEKTYNLGLSAANIYECWRYLQHAASFQKPKLVLLAIDKGMFDADSRPEVDFDEKRLAVAADGTPNPNWGCADIPETLLSLDAFVDSLKTLRNKTGVAYKDGMRDEVLLKPYMQAAKVLSENVRWKEMSRKFAWRYGSNQQVNAFRNILILCAEQRIDLRIFTNPLHAEMLDIEYGDGKDFAAWAEWLAIPKSGLVGRPIDGSNPAARSGNTKGFRYEFPIRNFYHFLPENSEPFPKPGEKVSAMKSYWEISHYKKAVGDRVLSEVMRNDRPAEGDWLTTLQAERAQWKETR